MCFRRGLERIHAARLPSAPIHAPARPSMRRRFLLHFWTPLALKQRHQAGSPALGRTEQGPFGPLYTHDDKKTRSMPLLTHVGRVSNHHTTFHNDAAVPDAPLPYFVAPKTKPPKNAHVGTKMTRDLAIFFHNANISSPCLWVCKKAHASC